LFKFFWEYWFCFVYLLFVVSAATVDAGEATVKFGIGVLGKQKSHPDVGWLGNLNGQKPTSMDWLL
jgi:hypothetical protein